MRKIYMFLCASSLFLLAGCQTGNDSPWELSGYSRPAQGAPNSLIAPKYRPVDVATMEMADSIVTTETIEAVEDEYEYGEGSSNWQGVWNPEEAGDLAYEQDQTGGYGYSYGSAQEQMPESWPQSAVATNISTVRVALLAPLSGKYKALGQALLQSAQLALFDMEFGALEILPRDTKGTVQGGAEAAQSAITAGAELVIGPLFAAAVEGAKPVLRRYDVNMIAFSTDWSLADNRTFIMGFLPFAQVQRVAEYAAMKGLHNIGILTPNTGYGNAVIAAYNSLAYRIGLNTAEVERFSEEDADLSEIVKQFTKYDYRKGEMAQIRRSLELQAELNPEDEAVKAELDALKNVDTWGLAPFDAVLLPVGGDQARSLTNLLSFYDLGPGEVKRLGTGLWDDPGLATEPAFEGAWFAAPQPESRMAFMERYTEIYDSKPPRLATLAYDAMALAVVLAQQGYQTTGSPSFDSRSITNPNGFSGLDGIFRFRSDGLVERGLAVQEFHKGSIRVIDPAPTSFQQANVYQ